MYLPGTVPFGKFSSLGPSSLWPFFLTTLNPRPSLDFLAGEGDKAFSYSEISWKDGLGRFSSAFWIFNPRTCSCNPCSSSRAADSTTASACCSPAAVSSSTCCSRESCRTAGGWGRGWMPYWGVEEDSGAFSSGVFVEDSMGSGCI